MSFLSWLEQKAILLITSFLTDADPGKCTFPPVLKYSNAFRRSWVLMIEDQNEVKPSSGRLSTHFTATKQEEQINPGTQVLY